MLNRKYNSQIQMTEFQVMFSHGGGLLSPCSKGRNAECKEGISTQVKTEQMLTVAGGDKAGVCSSASGAPQLSRFVWGIPAFSLILLIASEYKCSKQMTWRTSNLHVE